MNEKFKDLIPPILTSNQLDPDKILERTISIMGLLLDDIQLSIQQFPHISKTEYVNIDRTPNGIMQSLIANSRGIELVNIKNAQNTDRDKTIFQVWNRILNNIFYILKSKGTAQALRYIMVIYGIDPQRINLIEKTVVKSEDVYSKSINKRHSFLTSATATFNHHGLTSANSNWAMELQVKRDTVGRIFTWDYKGGSIILDVNNGAISGCVFGSSSGTITTPLSSFPNDSYYLVSVQKSGSTISMYRHNFIHGSYNTTTSIPVFTTGALSTSAGLTAFSSNPKIQFASSASLSSCVAGGISELRTWNIIPSNQDFEYRLFNWDSIVSTGGTSSLLAHYKFNEQQSLSSNLSNANWFVNSANSSITSQITTGSFSTDTLSSVYSYFVNTKTDIIDAFGVLPTNNKIGVSGTNSSSNLFSLGYEPMNAFNDFIFNRDRSFSMVSLYGNNEEYYQNSLPNIDSYLASVYNSWNSRFLNLSKFDEILDATEYMLASFFEFITQLLAIKSELLESGNIIKNHILNNISQPRKDNEGDISTVNKDIEFDISVINSAIEYIKLQKTYSNPYESTQLNKYYRDSLGNIVSPLETISTNTDSSVLIQPTGTDYLIISNENEDLPYNFINNIVYVVDSAGDTLIGAKVRLTADGKPSNTAWQFIDPSTLETFIYKAEFINANDSGFEVKIKYDAATDPFTEQDNGIYNLTFRTSNLGNASVSKPITAKLARNIQVQAQSWGMLDDFISNVPFISIAYNFIDKFIVRDRMESKPYRTHIIPGSIYLTFVEFHGFDPGYGMNNGLYGISYNGLIEDIKVRTFIRELLLATITNSSRVGLAIADTPVIIQSPILRFQSYDTTKLY